MYPGDFCLNNTNCFNYANGANCTNNKCVAALALNQTCPTTGSNTDHRYCPVGTYCDPTAKQCLAVKTLGQACADLVECLPGYACVATNGPKYDSYTCQKYFSLENGQSFSNKYMNVPNGAVIGSDSMCKTYNHVNISTDITIRECRKGDLSFSTSVDDFKREGTNLTCNYYSWSVNGTNSTTSKALSDTARCGFNKGSSYWCTMRKGDKLFTDAYAKFMALDLTEFKCHVLSTYERCTDFIITLAKNETLKQLAKAKLAAGSDGLFHLFANNDKCVAQAITTAYWQGEDPSGSGVAHSVYTALIAIASIISLIALF